MQCNNANLKVIQTKYLSKKLSNSYLLLHVSHFFLHVGHMAIEAVLLATQLFDLLVSHIFILREAKRCKMLIYILP